MNCAALTLMLLTLLVSPGCIYNLQCGIIMSSEAAEVYYSIETGELTSEAAQESAVAKLSSKENQESWWQLAKADWHDSALRRYFAAGPLKPKEMEDLAAHSGLLAGHDKLMDTLRISLKGPTDLVQALQNISTSAYRMSSFITGTGLIEASMWTLVFKCIGPSCSQGMVPMIIVNNTQGHSSPVYASLWLPASRSLLVNAAPSFINSLPPANPVPCNSPLNNADNADSDFSAVNNVRESQGIRSCPSTALRSYRSTLLDAAYGLVPGSACIQFDAGSLEEDGHLHPFKLLVSIHKLNDSINMTQDRDLGFFITEYLSSSMSWIILPFGECAEQPVLTVSLDQLTKSHNVIVCINSTCVSSSLSSNISCMSDSEGPDGAAELLHRLAALVAVAKFSPECTVPPAHKGEQPTPLNYSMSDVYSSWPSGFVDVDCPILGCKVSYQIAKDGMHIVNPSSNWTATKGFDTSEFQQAPKAGQAPCKIVHESLFLSQTVFNSKQMNPPIEVIEIRAKAYLTSYIAGHNIAFTTAKGPATDIYTFIALLVSTAISVMLAVAGHFSNFLLKWICRMSPFHLDCDQREGKARKWAKVALLVGCNVLLSKVFFLPVFSVAWNEIEREKPFHTWDLGSSDLFYKDAFQSKKQLRVLYLLSATSNYNSHFVTAITTVVFFTCLVVAITTIRRCKLISTRYHLLQQYDLMFPSTSSTSDDDTTLKAAATLRALKAIEMTEVEYLEKSREIMRLKIVEDRPPAPTVPEPDRPATPTPLLATLRSRLSISRFHPTPNRAYSLPARTQNVQSLSRATINLTGSISLDEAETSHLLLSNVSIHSA